jgi:Uncharacterized ABC-type transport system, periplasmic component/surface lipoprotein
MSKKLTKVFSGVAAALLLAAGCGGGTTAATDQKSAVLVTDQGGANDKSFNQGTNEGIIAFANANTNWVASAAIESLTEQDYTPNLANAADENDVVIAAGFLIQDAIVEAASGYPDVNFVGIDIDLTGVSTTNNVTGYTFAEQEAGYLAGVAAGMQTKTNKVGYIGGMEVPAVQRFGWGFIAGVQSVSKDIEVVYDYSGSFNDVALGTQKAQAMYNTGVDVIFIAAGETGVGAINEAKTQVQAGKDVWAIGVDIDQYEDGILPGSDKSVILTSAIKKVGEAVTHALQSVEDGTFNGGGTTNLTIQDGAVGLPDVNPNLSDEIIAAVATAEEAIKDGSIVPPASKTAVDGTKVTGAY